MHAHMYMLGQLPANQTSEKCLGLHISKFAGQINFWNIEHFVV